MTFFILQCSSDTGKPQAELLPDSAFPGSWKTGTRFAQAPREPIELTWDPETEHGEKLAFYDKGPVLMRADLVAALRESGVDNLDTYEVVLRSKSAGSGQEKYLAVNIVGVIAAADMAQSEVEDPSDGLLDVLFETLVVDEEKAGGQLFFRLAESTKTVIVHETVAKKLMDQGGFGLTLASAGSDSR